VSRKYEKHLVLKLNKAMREGTNTNNLFEELTGKAEQKLSDEWRATFGLCDVRDRTDRPRDLWRSIPQRKTDR